MKYLITLLALASTVLGQAKKPVPLTVDANTGVIYGAPSAATFRTGAGFGTMSTQNANAVNITGGTITGVSGLGGGNVTFADAAARAAAVPTSIGQLGFQLDTFALYRSTGTSAGNWSPDFVSGQWTFNSNINVNSFINATDDINTETDVNVGGDINVTGTYNGAIINGDLVNSTGNLNVGGNTAVTGTITGAGITGTTVTASTGFVGKGATQIFGNSAATSAGAPAATGQLAVQTDSGLLLRGTGTGAGNWSSSFGFTIINASELIATEVNVTTLTAGTLAGDGGSITDIDAGNIAAGTLANARLNANVTSGVICFDIDGAGAAVATGIQKANISIPWACTITKVRVTSDVSATCEIDLLKDTAANFPPLAGDDITSTDSPKLTAQTYSEDTSLGWTTTAVAAGDFLKVNVIANDNATFLHLEIFYTK